GLEAERTMATDVSWLDSQVRLLVEIAGPNGCNAFWDGTGLNFLRESAQCNATARIADVVYHESGHGLHQHLSVGGFIAPDVGEGSADYLAATINGDAAIGPTFYKASAAPLRDLEPDLVYPDDVSGEPHHDGQIWGGAW